MRRNLPPQASLEHLKKQAKDLLEGHKQRDPQALARIRDAVPAFAGTSDELVASGPFALHDAQSAIAREYGSKSWGELRDAVAAQAVGDPGPSNALLRALMPLPFPGEVGALLREASTQRARAIEAAEAGLPPLLPLVAIRDALLLPHAIGPIHVGRPASRAAVEFALGRTPPTLAVFAQRTTEDAAPSVDSLHAVGCEAYLHARLLDGADHAWIVLEGVRWLALESVEVGPGGYAVARVRAVARETGNSLEVGPLTETLRAHVRGLASAFPEAEVLLERIDVAEPDHLADLVVANLPVSVADKAHYAAEPRLSERLRLAGRLSGLTPTP